MFTLISDNWGWMSHLSDVTTTNSDQAWFMEQPTVEHNYCGLSAVRTLVPRSNWRGDQTRDYWSGVASNLTLKTYGGSLTGPRLTNPVRAATRSAASAPRSPCSLTRKELVNTSASVALRTAATANSNVHDSMTSDTTGVATRWRHCIDPKMASAPRRAGLQPQQLIMPHIPALGTVYKQCPRLTWSPLNAFVNQQAS